MSINTQRQLNQWMQALLQAPRCVSSHLITLDSLVGSALTHLSLRAMQWSSSSRSRSKTWAVCQNVTRRSDLIWFLWLDETTRSRSTCVSSVCAICANWRKLLTRDYRSPEHSLIFTSVLFTACHSKKTCKVNTYCTKTDTKWISDYIFACITWFNWYCMKLCF